MPIDNEIYDRIGQTWWDERSPLNILHGSMTPGRFAYFREVLARQYADRTAGLRALDVGCGGGFLAEEFARLGFDVVGVDPSAVSIEAARTHAAASDLTIDYRVGAGEQLPLEDGTFDLAYCCDVLEHVSDLDRVISETARVLKPGGLYLFDTVNRTLQSKLVAIKIAQEWPLTRTIDTPMHDWQMFIKPAELARALDQHGLHLGETVGLGPRAKMPTVIRSFISASKGRITYGECSRRVDFGRMKSTAVSYMGYATKAPYRQLRAACLIQRLLVGPLRQLTGPSHWAYAGWVRCSRCGASLGEDHRFCGDCGTPAGARCPSCGEPLIPGTPHFTPKPGRVLRCVRGNFHVSFHRH